MDGALVKKKKGALGYGSHLGAKICGADI